MLSNNNAAAPVTNERRRPWLWVNAYPPGVSLLRLFPDGISLALGYWLLGFFIFVIGDFYSLHSRGQRFPGLRNRIVSRSKTRQLFAGSCWLFSNIPVPSIIPDPESPIVPTNPFRPKARCQQSANTRKNQRTRRMKLTQNALSVFIIFISG